MKTLAIGHTESGAYWVFEFATHEEAVEFLDKAAKLKLPNHEVFDVQWDLMEIEPTTVAQAIAEMKEIAQ